MKTLILFLLSLTLPGVVSAQLTPDCDIKFTFTAASNRSSITGCGNNTAGITDWRVVYVSNGFTAVSVAVQDAADSSGSPGTWTNWQGTIAEGSNPSTSTTFATARVQGYYPWVSVTLSSATGSGTVTGHLFGCRTPGCGAVAAQIGPRPFGATFVNGGSALSGSTTVCGYLPYAGTIESVVLLSTDGTSGNATVDVLSVAFSSYTGPGSASSITASATPALSSAVKYKDTTLSGWTRKLNADSVICFALSSPSLVKGVEIELVVD